MQVPFRPIRSKVEYQAVVDRLSALFSAEPNSSEGDELEMLMLLVEDYDRKHAPVHPLHPLEAIRIQMNELGLRQKDLVSAIGSEARVSEVLSGRRKLTLKMIRPLADVLHLPVQVLVGPTPEEARQALAAEVKAGVEEPSHAQALTMLEAYANRVSSSLVTLDEKRAIVIVASSRGGDMATREIRCANPSSAKTLWNLFRLYVETVSTRKNVA